MKKWYGYPVLECECGFENPDEDEFREHLLKTGHKQKTACQTRAGLARGEKKAGSAEKKAEQAVKKGMEESHDEKVLHE